MIGKDSTGIRLYAALITRSFGEFGMSFNTNFAASTPPRFLLYQTIDAQVIQQEKIYKDETTVLVQTLCWYLQVEPLPLFVLVVPESQMDPIQYLQC